ncbi:response regulator transcription factor [Patescibacteria group bacterium]|nr:response regulator transcription factor [Patescibacteria group bacterium]
MRILIAEDNRKLAGYIKQALGQQGYTVDSVYDGETAENRMSDEYDLVILDIMLPQKDGITVCNNVRGYGSTTPILMLTAKGELDDKVDGLDAGADDYLIKPFEMKELLARIRALLRRPKEKKPEKLIAQNITLDGARHIVLKGEDELSLTLKEYSVLDYIIRNKNKTVTREQILDHCWDFSYDSFSNIVDVYIKRLRKKLQDKNEQYIKTIRGIGYQFKE